MWSLQQADLRDAAPSSGRTPEGGGVGGPLEPGRVAPTPTFGSFRSAGLPGQPPSQAKLQPLPALWKPNRASGKQARSGLQEVSCHHPVEPGRGLPVGEGRVDCMTVVSVRHHRRSGRTDTDVIVKTCPIDIVLSNPPARGPDGSDKLLTRSLMIQRRHTAYCHRASNRAHSTNPEPFQPSRPCDSQPLQIEARLTYATHHECLTQHNNGRWVRTSHRRGDHLDATRERVIFGMTPGVYPPPHREQ